MRIVFLIQSFLEKEEAKAKVYFGANSPALLNGKSPIMAKLSNPICFKKQFGTRMFVKPGDDSGRVSL